MIKSFLISLVSFIVLDFLWLGFVVKGFNMRQLSEIGRFENGEFKIFYVPALIVYFMLAALVTFFVLPKVTDAESIWPSFAWGALLGLLVYGVFDMTNLSILNKYPIAFALADMAWGTFVFGFVSALTFKTSQ